MTRSIGGVTIGNGWMHNNPDLLYDNEPVELETMKQFKPRPLSNLRVKPFTLYKVQVSFNPSNPFFTCLLLVGFTHCNRPAGYSKLVGTDIDEIEDGFSDIQCRAMEEVCSINFDDYGV